MKNKIFTTLLLIVMIASLGLFAVACDGTPETKDPAEGLAKWTGSIATDDEMYEVYDNDTNTFTISTADQLAWIAKTVNTDDATARYNFVGATIKLANDINLDNKAWAPIGNVDAYPSKTFAGTFDGNGKTIYNLKATDKGTGSANSTAAMFGSVMNATIKNLTVYGATIESDHYAAVLVGYTSNGATIENCTVKNANVKSSPVYLGTKYDNGDKVGGLVGYGLNLNISGCTVENSSLTAYRDMGGLVGCIVETTSIVNNNTVKNVVLTQDFTNGYKEISDVEDKVSEFVGRNSSTLGENVKTNVVIRQINK